MRLALLLSACTPSLTLPAKPIPVVITAPIPLQGRTCFLMEPPSPPPDIEIDHEIESVIARTTVSFARWNEMTRWARDMATWADDLRQCVYHLTGEDQ